MPKLKSLEDLALLRANFQKDVGLRLDVGTTITVGMGTCGITAGAREVMHAILEELEKRNIEAHVTTVGCIGMCAKEPLVDIHQAGKPTITYGKITPAMVPRLIEEHLIKNQAIQEWVVKTEGAGAKSS
jgi:NADP-reducing hydrogenase subunit HndB